MNFYEKWNEVVKAAAYVQQSGRNTFQKYNYVTERDLLDAIRPTMTTLGLLFFLAKTEIVPEATHGPLITIRATYRLLDTETGQSEDIVVFGQGSDTQDKGVYKAHTGARKYALRQFTLIATGDDPEEDTDSADVFARNPASVTVARKLMSVGIQPVDERIQAAVGCTLYQIENNESGTQLLRKIHRAATELEAKRLDVDGFFAAITAVK